MGGLLPRGRAGDVRARGSLRSGRRACQPRRAEVVDSAPRGPRRRPRGPGRYHGRVARPRSVHACTRCGAQQPRWLGRCPECGSWGTLVEEPVGDGEPAARELVAPASPAKPRRLAEIDPDAAPRIATGISELDRVLGGGLVPGAVVLLAGEPGVGKSTLGLQLAARARTRGRVLYVTGEESPE